MYKKVLPAVDNIRVASEGQAQKYLQSQRAKKQTQKIRIISSWFFPRFFLTEMCRKIINILMYFLHVYFYARKITAFLFRIEGWILKMKSVDTLKNSKATFLYFFDRGKIYFLMQYMQCILGNCRHSGKIAESLLLVRVKSIAVIKKRHVDIFLL